MENKKIKWLIYTVTIGLIPILLRIIIWLVTNQNIDLLNSSDIIIFGLILHISNINELEHFNKYKSWKTIQNGLSILFIAIYSLLFALTLLSNINTFIDNDILIKFSAGLALVSFIISYSIYDRINKLGGTK